MPGPGTGGADELTVEILVHPAAGGGVAGAPPRPAPGVVEKLRRQLAGRGVVCHATPFGLVCTAGREAMGRIFGPSAETAGPGATLPVPTDLADVIEQVTVPVMPELFP